MGSGTFYPVASGDDGGTIGGTYYQVLTYLGVGDGEKSYIYFNDVLIPKHSIIDVCHMTVQCSNFNEEIQYTNLYFNDAADGTKPSTEELFDAMDLTAGKRWDFTSWNNGTLYDTPDLSDILQTVIDRADWVSGNGVTVVSRSTEIPGVVAHLFWSIDKVPAQTLELHVEWHSAFRPRVTMVM
jgi:hypothetical protein